MELKIQKTNFRLASRIDKPVIKNILIKSFRKDPQISWLTEQSSHNNKLEIIMNYIIEETFNDGKIFITLDNSAVALWKTEKKETLTLEYLKRNLNFLIKMGISCVIRNLRNKKNTYRQFPKRQKFYYLYTIGVLPEAQGKGLASQLMDPVIEACKTQNIPLYLETANPKNVLIYRKKGFILSETLVQKSIHIFYMKLCFA